MRGETKQATRSTRPGLPGLEAGPRPIHRCYLSIACVLVVSLFAVLAVRLFNRQVLQHDHYRKRVSTSLEGTDSRQAIRGFIRTQDGTNLAVDVPRFNLALDPGDPRDPERVPPEWVGAVIDFVCNALNVPQVHRRSVHEGLERRRSAYLQGRADPPRYVVLAHRLERARAVSVVADLVAAVEAECTESGMKAERVREYVRRVRRGVAIEPAHYRLYPRGAFLSHVIGSVCPGERSGDLQGLEGVERSQNAYLEGWDGHRKVRCDASRAVRLYSSDHVDIPPTDGYNVRLTILSRVQAIVEEELAKGVAAKEAAAGAAIVMDCRDGDILALASYPDYDPGEFHRYPPQELAERRRNRVIESQFEPGSTIKPLIAAVALEKGLFRLDEIVWGGGRTARILNRRVEDYRDHGAITFEEAVVYSSNIGMTWVGLRLGKPGLNDVLDRFRFGVETGVRLPGEAAGKRRRLEKWTERNTSISVSFGYAVTVTPLQLAAAYCGLVNGGYYYRPRLIDRRGDEVMPRELVSRPVDERTSRRMRDTLHQVVDQGTARFLKIPGLPFGGKTGTARLSQGRRGYAVDGAKQYTSSFVAFAPYSPEHPPEIVVLVMIEKPNRRLGYYGSVVAGPVVRAILARMYRAPAEDAVAPVASSVAAHRRP